MTQFDEALKGAPDVARSQAHFTMVEDEALQQFRRAMEENFYLIQQAVEDKANRKKLLEFLRSGQFEVQIPAWNEADTIGPIIEHLKDQLGDAHRIVVMDADSTDETAAVAEQLGARVIRQKDMYSCIKREPFLEILNDDAPRGRGMTLFAFWIYRFLVQQENLPRYTCYCDSDIKNFSEYDPMPYLVYPLVFDSQKNFGYLKIAKPGRNNETVMGARCALRPVGELGNRYFRRLARDMWMITGEYIVEVDYMRRLCHCTRSFVDTFTAMYFADLEEARKTSVAIVHNPNSRLDKKNDEMKEQTILYSIATNLVAFAAYGKEISAFELADVRKVNRELINTYTLYPYIPSEPSPMKVASIVNDRVVPSVAMLEANDLIDRDALRNLQSQYRRT